MTNQSRIEELLLRWQDHCEQGEDVPAEVLGAGCPELVPELDRQIQAMRNMDRLCRAVTGPTETPGDTGGNPGPAHVDVSFLSPPQKPDEIGRLGHYRVFKVRGAGGMGIVFEAEDSQLERRVALKVMRPEAASPILRQSFLREARAAAALQHDHVITIYQVGQENSVPFLAMQLLQGESLEDYLRRAGRLPVAEVLRIGREVAAGLGVAHRRGLVHRDIKPANLWLETPHGRVKILDFGLVRSADDTQLTAPGMLLGTPAYMAPEQAQALPVDVRGDLFSLGCVLYRACTGQLPFEQSDVVALLMAMATELPKPPQEIHPQVPRALSDLILRLLAPDPSDRLPSAEAVIEALDRVGDAPAGAPAAPAAPPAADEPMRVVITVVAGPHEGQVFTFAGHDTFLVGRSKEAHFRLPKKDEYFSRIHFMVEMNPPYCRLIDLGSTNGTHVNGQRVTVADLADGDQIQGGQTVLQVALKGTGSEPVTRHGVAPPPPAPAPVTPFVPVTLLDAAQVGPLPPIAGQYPWAHRPARAVCTAPAPNLDMADGRTVPVCADCRAYIEGQPQPITGYRLVRELGRGGMGVVFLALREADCSVVALKTIKPAIAAARADVERFLREADVLRRLQHPHIVSFRDLGEANDRLYFAMDYVRGTDAAKLLQRHGPLSIPRAVTMVSQLLEALEYAHARGFVHRDVKPANLLVAEEAGGDVARLADFGLARVYQASRLSGLTLTGQTGGTAPFMAPEQITNFREAQPAADQYAVAATLYNLLTGCYVFDFPQQFAKRLLMVLQEEPVPIRSRRADVPSELAQVIHRGLAKEPGQRFADAATMRQALATWSQ